MPDYSSYKPTSDGDGRDYVQKWPAFVDRVGEDMDEKAPLIHSHDGGDGAVIAIGEESARPAGVEGFVFSNTTDGELEVLDASGNVLFTVAKATDASVTGLRVSRPDAATIEIKAGTRIPIGGGVYRVETDLTLDVATIAGETLLTTQWYWICAAAPANGQSFVAGDFYAYRVTVNWYDGGYWIPGTNTGKRVLFPVRTDGSGNVIDFSLNGGYWMPIYPVQLRSLDTASPATSTTAVTMLVPSANGHRYQIDVVATLIANGSEALLRFGSTGAVPTNLENALLRSTSTGYVANTMRVVADTDRQIFYIANSNATSVTLSVGGFLLPPGMTN